MSRHIETLSKEVLRLGLQGRVSGSHLTSMPMMDNYYVSKLIPLIAESEINVIPNPLTNIAVCGTNKAAIPNGAASPACRSSWRRASTWLSAKTA